MEPARSLPGVACSKFSGDPAGGRYVTRCRSFCLVSIGKTLEVVLCRPEDERTAMSEIWIRSPREWQQAAFEDFTSRLPQTGGPLWAMDTGAAAGTDAGRGL